MLMVFVNSGIMYLKVDQTRLPATASDAAVVKESKIARPETRNQRQP